MTQRSRSNDNKKLIRKSINIQIISHIIHYDQKCITGMYFISLCHTASRSKRNCRHRSCWWRIWFRFVEFPAENINETHWESDQWHNLIEVTTFIRLHFLKWKSKILVTLLSSQKRDLHVRSSWVICFVMSIFPNFKDEKKCTSRWLFVWWTSKYFLMLFVLSFSL